MKPHETIDCETSNKIQSPDEQLNEFVSEKFEPITEIELETEAENKTFSNGVEMLIELERLHAEMIGRMIKKFNAQNKNETI
jgi:hypothetical protein